MNLGLILTLVSLAFLILVSTIYFSKKRITLFENKIYEWMLISSIIGLVLNCFSFMVDIYIPDILIIRTILVKLYYGYIIFLIILFTSYMYFSSRKHDNNKKKYFITMGTIFLLINAINFILPLEFIHEGHSIIVSGIGIYFVYFVVFIALVGWILYIFSNFRNINRTKYYPIISFVLIIIPVVFLEMAYPELLLEPVVISFTLVFMYFTIENPDVKMLGELQFAKDHAEKANRAKSEFLSSMSHEIRTPLNAIVGFSECIKTETNIDEAQKDADDIIMASQNLLEIVNGILDISKIEANKMEIVNVDYELAPNLNNLVKLMLPRVEEKPIEILTKFGSDIPTVMHGDIGKIKQIITNLLTNSVKYTEKGKILFSVNCVNEGDMSSLVISVEDTGRGIKPEKIDGLFTKFNRLEEDRNTTLEGTGLGLAITKSLVEMMGGKIVVQSIYGQGSRFTVYLKQKIVQFHPGTEVEVTNQEEKFNFSGNRILIVDDNKLNLKVADRILKSYNTSNVMVESGYKAIELIKTNQKFDLILMDDMMPKISGTDTLNGLLKIEGFNTPVISLTANAIAGMEEQYLRKGFNGYLAKPIEREELTKVLKKFLKVRSNFESAEKIVNEKDSDISTLYDSNDLSQTLGRKVLLVDDNKINIRIASNFLRPYKLDVDDVLSGRECIDRIINGEEYDLIFMDDMMPEMSGIETMHKLKEMNIKTPIVVLTANAVDGSKEGYLKEGFNDYISKPIIRTELDRILKKFLKSDNIIVSSQDGVNVKSINNSPLFSPFEKGNLEYLKSNGINVEGGIEILGAVDIYNDTLKCFSEDIDLKINKLDTYFKNREINNYVVELHALNSDCKYLGFTSLVDILSQQELKSNERDMDYVVKNHTYLLTQIGIIKDLVNKYLGKY